MKHIYLLLSLTVLSALALAVACTTADKPRTSDTDAMSEASTDKTKTEIETKTTLPDTEAESETIRTVAEEAADARELLKLADGKKIINVFGQAEYDEQLFQPLQDEIDKLEAEGHMVSFIIADIKGNFGFAYNCDKKWTSQSTVKAPYLTSVLMQDASVFAKEKRLIKAVITVSDNDAYETLRNKYGNEPFKTFCKESGISVRHAADLYPRSITVRDMAKLWTTMYEFLNTREDMETYISYFTGTAFSCVYQALGETYKVQTKAGWESGTGYDGPGGEPDPRFTDGDPLNDEIATNDTGIVYAGEHPYIIAIFTNVQADTAPLIPLVRAIDTVHGELIQ